MNMKRLMQVCLMILCMVPFYFATADEISWEKSKEMVLAAVEDAYPGWTVCGSSVYGSGSYHDEMAVYVDVLLFRVENHTLCWLKLSELVNPLWEGGSVEWHENHLAPVSLSEQAAVDPDEMIPQLQYPEQTGTPWLSHSSGCAEFMLREGERWEELGAMSHELVGVAVDAAGRKGLRVASWDGTSFGAVIASPMAETDFELDTFHSGDGGLILWVGDYEAYISRGSDGIWRWTGVNNGYAVYSFCENCLLDEYPWWEDSNDNRHYGSLSLGRTLEELQIDRMVFRGPQLVEFLDAKGWACVRDNETPMFSAPDGEIIALCYSRLAGRILSEENGWVCLQIGSEGHGLKAWFRRDQLAFGAEIERIHCGFPVYEAETVDGYAWRPKLTAFVNRVLDQPFGPLEVDEGFGSVWIIGHSPDGRWLMEVEEDVVAFTKSDAIVETRPAPEYEIPFDFSLTDAEWEALWSDSDE